MKLLWSDELVDNDSSVGCCVGPSEFSVIWSWVTDLTSCTRMQFDGSMVGFIELTAEIGKRRRLMLESKREFLEFCEEIFRTKRDDANAEDC